MFKITYDNIFRIGVFEMIFQKKSPKDKEWELLLKQEDKMLRKRENKKESQINKLLEDKVPEKLQSTLNAAFRKAFEIVFSKGSGIIEKTYDKEKYDFEYENRERWHAETGNRRSLKSFSKAASAGKNKNILLSGIEGAGMGALGVGIPDIPVFTGVILKSIYEVAMSYGFEYESDFEKFFILKIIEVSMQESDKFEKQNDELNRFIDEVDKYEFVVEKEDIDYQIAAAANSVSKEMLYMKFVQGIPVIGIAGGLTNTVYLKKIVDYAELKYRRRFLISKGKVL